MMAAARGVVYRISPASAESSKVMILAGEDLSDSRIPAYVKRYLLITPVSRKKNAGEFRFFPDLLRSAFRLFAACRQAITSF